MMYHRRDVHLLVAVRLEIGNEDVERRTLARPRPPGPLIGRAVQPIPNLCCGPPGSTEHGAEHEDVPQDARGDAQLFARNFTPHRRGTM